LDTGCVVIDGLQSLGKVDGKYKVVFARTKVDEETKIVYLTVSDGPLCRSVTNFKSMAKEVQLDPKDWSH